MKKKVLSIALVVAVVAMMVGGTLAYFTAEDDVTNTFTVGSVKIEIWENDKVTDKDQVTFEKPLLPVVNNQDVTQDPGYAAKVVKVENTGANDALIRTHIAVPQALVGYLDLKLTEGAGWNFVRSTEAEVEDVRYTVYTYDYQTAVAPNDFTAELLQGAYLKSEVDIKDNPATPSADLEFCKPATGGYTFSGYVAHEAVTGGYTSKTVSVLVASQAIQAQGFEGRTATDALDTGFGDGNPWQ